MTQNKKLITDGTSSVEQSCKGNSNKSNKGPAASSLNPIGTPEAETNPTIDTTSPEGATTEGQTDARNILIKLKYLNDTLKEVEGRLDELLKDFKWLVSLYLLYNIFLVSL